MQRRWRVLAPIDLSEDPEGPVEHAIEIANTMRAELSLLYVVDPRRSGRAGRLRWPVNALNEAQTHCDIHRLVLPGKPAEIIVRYAEYINADLVVMTRQSSRWSRFWRHSVTSDVMKYAHRPVCVTHFRPMGTDFHFSCRRILCVLKLDGTDEPLVQQAEALAKQSGADLMLLGIVPEIDEGLLLETIPEVDRPLSLLTAAERLRALGKGISVQHELTVRFGWTYSCIRAAAREHSADIVMVGRPSPGRIQFQSLDMESVLRQLSCPLLSIAGESMAVRPIAGAVSENTRVTAGLRWG